MGKKINATEAARSFSEIINSVKYKGESYTIIAEAQKSKAQKDSRVVFVAAGLSPLRVA